jgi:hypothetical protein
MHVVKKLPYTTSTLDQNMDIKKIIKTVKATLGLPMLGLDKYFFILIKIRDK